MSDRGAVSLSTSGSSADVAVGYGRLEPGGGNAGPVGLAIFGFRQNGVLVTEAGVQASGLIQSGRIPAFVDGPLNTGIATANPYSQDVTVSFYFTDQNGTTDRSGSIAIPAYSHIARFLTEAPFNSGSSFQGAFTFTSKGEPALNLSNPFAAAVPAELTIQAADPHMRNSYTQDWQLSLQNEIVPAWNLEVAYAGRKRTHYDRTILANVPLPGPGALQSRRPNPNFGRFSILHLRCAVHIAESIQDAHHRHRFSGIIPPIVIPMGLSRRGTITVDELLRDHRH